MYPRIILLGLGLLLAFTTGCTQEVELEDSLFADESKNSSDSVEFEADVDRIILPTNAFSKSLMDADLRIAYNTAITATVLNQHNHFDNYDKVMPLLSDLIHLTGVRNIYLISHNNNLQNFTKNFCNQHGYVYNSAVTASDALQELHYSPSRDLILLDSALEVTDARGKRTEKYFQSAIEVNEDPKASTSKNANSSYAWPPLIKSAVNDHAHPIQALFAREVYLWLKKDVRTNHIPVAILSLVEGTENEISLNAAKDIYGDKVADYLTKPLSTEALKKVCDNLFHNSDKPGFLDAKVESEKLVIKACRAVAALEGKATIFDTKILNNALIQSLKEPAEGETASRPPHLRVELIKCAAAINVQEAFIHIAKVAQNKENLVSLRKAAIEAMGKLIGKNNRVIPKGNSNEDVIKLLSSFIAEDVDDIWESASFAFGHLKMNQKTKTELAVLHRLNKQRKE